MPFIHFYTSPLLLHWARVLMIWIWIEQLFQIGTPQSSTGLVPSASGDGRKVKRVAPKRDAKMAEGREGQSGREATETRSVVRTARSDRLSFLSFLSFKIDFTVFTTPGSPCDSSTVWQCGLDSICVMLYYTFIHHNKTCISGRKPTEETARFRHLVRVRIRTSFEQKERRGESSWDSATLSSTLFLWVLFSFWIDLIW